MSRTSKYQAKNRDSQPTFNEMFEATRENAARRLWARACTVSRLRHESRAATRWKQARFLGHMKEALIGRVIEIAPEQIQVSTDDKREVDLLSIQFNGKSRLHLPVNSTISDASSGARYLATSAQRQSHVSKV